MKRSFSAACILVLLATVATYFLVGNGGNVERPALVRSDQEEALAGAQMEAPELADLDAGKLAVEVERVEVIEPIPQVQSDVLLAGLVQIAELDGSINYAATGSLTLAVARGIYNEIVVVAIEDGAWELSASQLSPAREGQIFEPGGAASFADVDFPGRSTSVIWSDNPGRLQLGELDVLLRFEALIAPRLIVEDEASHAMLANVTVIAGGGAFEYRHAHRTGQVYVEDAPSPIELVLSPRLAQAAMLSVFIGSPGYVWQFMRISIQPGAETRVRLKRGGDLEVHLESLPEEGQLHLCFWSAQDGQMLGDFPVSEAGPHRLEGLEPGAVSVGVMLGDISGDSLELALGEAQIVAGETTYLNLQVEPDPEIQTAKFAGRIDLPEAWLFEEFQLQVSLIGTALDGWSGQASLDSSAMKRLAGNGYGFDFGNLQVGKYLMSLSEAGYGEIVEVSERGIDDFVFAVPNPASITVHLRDTNTGASAEVDHLHWFLLPAEAANFGLFMGMLQAAQKPQAGEPFRMQLPVGRVQVSIVGQTYGNVSKEINAKDGLELTIDIYPPSGVRIELSCDGQPVSWPKGLVPNGLLAKPRPGHVTGTKWGLDGVVELELSEPGHYSLVIPQIEGYENHAPVEVDIVRGETTQVNVELTWVP